MDLLLYVIPLVLLNLNSQPAAAIVSNFLIRLDIADRIVDLLDRLRSYKHNTPGLSYNDEILGTLAIQIQNLADVNDQNYHDLLKSLNKLPQEYLFLTDKKALMDSYSRMKDILVNLLNTQNGMNSNETFPIKEELTPISVLDDHWDKIHNLIKTQAFFTKLTPNWNDTYSKQWIGTCFTYMSELQVRYALLLQYINFFKNYFISRHTLYNLYEQIDKSDLSGNKKFFSKNLQSTINEDLDYFKSIMNDASREYWTCDPSDEETKKSSFHELQALTTYYTIKEHIRKPCELECYNTEVKTCTSKYDNSLCKTFRKCPHELIKCSSSNGMNICYNFQNETTYRRYVFVAERYNGRYCNKTISTMSYESYLSYYERTLSPENQHRLEYYNCLCRENDYYVNAFPVIASPGHVVIGAQLNLRDNMLYIEILQGKLEPDGFIEGAEYGPQFMNEAEWENYNFKLNWDDKIDLSPTKVPENENRVVTGLQFVKTGDRIHLAVYSKKLDVKSGTLVPHSDLISKKTQFGTKEFKFGSVDRSDESDLENTPVSNDDQYVKFNVTGLWEDGGQSTIPFIDAQQVMPDPYSPLSGVSFYIRGQKGYGGFLALKLYTFDVVPHIQKILRLADVSDEIGRKLRMI